MAARSAVLALLLCSACGESASTNTHSNVALPMKQEKNIAICQSTIPDKRYTENGDWSWFQIDKMTWCRTKVKINTAQKWVFSQNNPSHQLTISGSMAALTESAPELVLNRTAGPRTNVPSTCAGDERYRVFVRDNWLFMPPDLGCDRTYKGDGYNVGITAFHGDGGDIPAIAARPPEPQGTILIIRGGPYRGVLHGIAGATLTNHLLRRYASKNSILMPAYAGTDRIKYGNGDIAKGEDELDTIFRAIRADTHGKPLCVLASSMGAFVVAPLIAKYPDARFLLTSPLSSSPRNFIERALAAGTPTRPRMQLLSDGSKTRQIHPVEDSAFLDYFGTTADASLEDRLAPAMSRSNWSLLYSARDIVIGQEAMARLAARVPPQRVTRIARGNHAVEDRFNFEAFRPRVDEFMNACLSQK